MRYYIRVVYFSVSEFQDQYLRDLASQLPQAILKSKADNTMYSIQPSGRKRRTRRIPHYVQEAGK